MSKQKISLVLCACAILMAPCATWAADAGFPQTIELPKTVDRVELPSGSVIIDSLKKMGGRVHIPEPHKVNSTAPYKVALNLGLAVAGGFASISERDKGRLEKFAQIIFDYGRVLNVQGVFLSEYAQIRSAIDKGNWTQVGSLIAILQERAEIELNKSYRKDEAKLATVAGWMEGFHIVGKTLESNFNPKIAKELLVYRGLPDYLNKLIVSLKRQTKEKSEVREMLVALRQINEVINKPDSHVFTKQDVLKVLAVTTPLRQKIMK